MTPRRAAIPGSEYSSLAGLGRAVVRLEEGQRHLADTVERGEQRAAEGRAELKAAFDRRCDRTDAKVDGLAEAVRALLEQEQRRRGAWRVLRLGWKGITTIAALMLTAIGLLISGWSSLAGMFGR